MTSASRSRGEVLPFDEATVARFWGKVARAGPDACWYWRGRIKLDGYGNFRSKRRDYVASRVALALQSGVMPDAKTHALHSCDHPLCCNPKHLRWGTAQDNMNDIAARNRASEWNIRRFGEGNPYAKLTWAIVDDIRASGSPSKEIAQKYGVSAHTVWGIRANKRWPAEMRLRPAGSAQS
jgi:hypothetical protein